MVTIVVILNLGIACLCWYGVWHLGRLRQRLVRITAALTVAECHTHRVLQNAPNFWTQGQVGTTGLRLRYQGLLRQFQQLQQILTLLGLGQLVWRQVWKQERPPYGSKATRTSGRFYRSILSNLR
jgi:hypothetical protein